MLWTQGSKKKNPNDNVAFSSDLYLNLQAPENIRLKKKIKPLK